MLEEETESDSADFQLRSSNFLKWFKSNPSIRLSMKITLADLRSRNAGRGVREYREGFLLAPYHLTCNASGNYRYLC
jgi:hypothetical protein